MSNLRKELHELKVKLSSHPSENPTEQNEINFYLEELADIKEECYTSLATCKAHSVGGPVSPKKDNYCSEGESSASTILRKELENWIRIHQFILELESAIVEAGMNTQESRM